MRDTISMLVCCLLLAAGSRGDVVVLKDGRRFEGKVLEETRSMVRIDCMVANIRTTVEFSMHDVASITREVLPDDFFAPKRKRSTPDRERPQARERGPAPVLYTEIPVSGAFGEEVTAHGLREALDAARRRKVEHVVFRVDSPGGYAYEAAAISDVLKEHADAFTYHTWIDDEAFSAAMVFVAWAEHIYVTPLSRLGAATAYLPDDGTGNAQVDAKLNAAWASQLASAAAVNGHPPLLFEASVEMPVEVYHVVDGTGAHRFTRQHRDGAELIDSALEVLTLTGGQMLDWELAQGPVESSADIGELAGLRPWKSTGIVGAQAMEQAAAERARISEKFETTLARTLSRLEEAVDKDPTSVTIWYDESSGLLTPKQQDTWRRMSDEAIAIRRNVSSLMHELKRLDREAERIGAMHLQLGELEVDLDTIYTNNESRLQWLIRNRSRTHIDDIK